ncbi:MAG: hypothetical protein VW078_07185 [Flavobacteriales bacterium]|jgi:hypothetical protein|tara:strand:+ start:389 stop:925 length:537 start_codon:yes stop_codon:yes gene_type:complete
MKKFTLLIIFYLVYFISFSQKSSEKVSVEKSILSIQTGYFGTWINHELKLHKKIALRTEVGTEYRLKFAIKQSFDSLKNQVSIFLEPKYYFNLVKRESKNKNIKNNAGNYISLRTNFNILNNLENGDVYFHNLTPTFGIRRNITSHFNLELSFGYGISYSNSLILIEAMPSFRFGYTF